MSKQNGRARLDLWVLDTIKRLAPNENHPMLSGRIGQYLNTYDFTLSIQGSDCRAVRASCHRLRERGYPIGSCGRGYYWAGTPEGIALARRHQIGRIIKQARALRAFDRATYQAVLEALGQERMVQDA